MKLRFGVKVAICVVGVLLLVVSAALSSSNEISIPVADYYKAVPFTAGDMDTGQYPGEPGETYKGEPARVLQFWFPGDPEFDTPPAFTIDLGDVGIEPGEYYIGLRVRAGVVFGDVGYLKFYSAEVDEPIEFTTAAEFQMPWVDDPSNPDSWGVTRVIMQSKDKYSLSNSSEIKVISSGPNPNVAEVHLVILYRDEIERGPIELPVEEEKDYSEYVEYDVFDVF